MTTLVCKICDNNRNRSFIAREMMYGTKDQFGYFECGNCGCLQLITLPKNIVEYYPDNFYAYQQPADKSYEVPSAIKSFIRRSRTNYLLTNKSLIGKIALRITGEYFSKTYDWNWLRKSNANTGSRILDIGCGNGKLLRALAEQGFSNLYGLDPFIKCDITYGPVTIYKKDLAQLEGSFDVIMLHHAFEHMPDPVSTLQQINKLLPPSGSLVIRIPLAGSYAWQTYGINWVQLDAPRHIFLHTQRSLAILARKTGFTIEETEFDSTSFQFSGSEQYMRDIPLKRMDYDADQSVFSENEMAEFKKRAAELNSLGQGDQACFYMKKVDKT